MKSQSFAALLLLGALGGPFAERAAAQNYGGYIDQVDCGQIAGRAWDGNQPNTPISVSVYADNVFVGTIVANIYRSDLAAFGMGNGYHAYALSTPALIKDSRPHAISVTVAGANFPLPSSGTSLQLACPGGATGYQYYYSDSFTSINSNWSQNGSVVTGTSGLNIPSDATATLTSTIPVPDGSSEYEVKGTLNLQASGGTFILYLRASPDLSTYYSVELQNVTFTGSSCSANLYAFKALGGAITTLYYAQVPCHNGMTVRAVIRNGLLLGHIDNQWYIFIGDSDIASGPPAVGGRQMAAGNSFSQVQLGPADRVAPNPLNVPSVAVNAAPTCVDLRWQGPGDDPNGTGIERYDVYRDGALLQAIYYGGMTDCTVNPGETHTYQLYSIDYHFNYSALSSGITVTVPPANAIDPRRVGVRPLGTYWGDMGEQIDVRSGNLNFTVPVLSAQGRGGWSVGFALNYNSQQWRHEGGIDWNMGEDVGYGYGWRLMAGSILPYWTGWWQVHHYIYTDSTGAEYRLDINNNNVWTSREGVYVAYDANTGILHFPDGSFWVMGCTSAGTEADAGAMYPTQIEDTNGNQLS